MKHGEKFNCLLCSLYAEISIILFACFVMLFPKIEWALNAVWCVSANLFASTSAFSTSVFVLFLVLVFCRFDRQFSCYPVMPVSDPDFHDSIFYSCRKLQYSPCVGFSVFWYFCLCLFLSFMKFCRQLSFIPAVFDMIMVLVAFLYEFYIQWCNFSIKSTFSPVSMCALLQFLL